MDTRIALAGMDFYFDQDFDGVIAANNIGVFEPGAVSSFPTTVTPASRLATRRIGVLQITLPYIDNVDRIVTPVNFDAQLKYDDCGGTYTDAYSGQSVSLEKATT